MPHEAISVFDMFKIGVGPSSSHTLGPWKAALRFINTLQQKNLLRLTESVTVLLYGSLAKTGKGHGTDIAVLMGLCGEDPVTIAVTSIASKTARIQSEKKLLLNGKKEIGVNVEFLVNETLSFHPNGLSFLADCGGSIQISETFFSIGGGFVVKENEDKNKTVVVDLPFPINTSEYLLHWCMKTGLSIHEVVMENENAWRKEPETKQGVLAIWQVMTECMYRGCHSK